MCFHLATCVSHQHFPSESTPVTTHVISILITKCLLFFSKVKKERKGKNVLPVRELKKNNKTNKDCFGQAKIAQHVCRTRVFLLLLHSTKLLEVLDETGWC